MKNSEEWLTSVSVERLELTDKSGRTLAVLGAEHGVPYMARYDGNGHILAWLTFLVDGTPDLRVFSQPLPKITDGQDTIAPGNGHICEQRRIKA
jgi:hypothetical protein